MGGRNNKLENQKNQASKEPYLPCVKRVILDEYGWTTD